MAEIGPDTKHNTAESKTIHENSNQILALDVLLFVKIKLLFATTILALRLFEVLLFCNRSPCDSTAIETGSESHPIPITDDCVEERWTLFDV